MSSNSKYKNIILFCTFMCSLIFTSDTLYARTLRAVLVADTYDNTIGPDTEVDINNMSALLQKAASKSGLASDVVIITGYSATRENVIKKIEQLEVEPDDVVMAYFSMHGYRTKDKESVWPNLFFGESENGLELEYVVSELQERHP